MTPGTERVIDARTAVDLTAAGMYGPDFLQKSPVRPRTGPDSALHVGVVTAPRCMQHLAHERHTVLMGVFGNETGTSSRPS